MSAGDPRPWDAMLPVALTVAAMLAPACARLAIAGSLRRGASSVGDVELVAVPASDGAVDDHCAGLLDGGIVTQRHKTNGSRLAWGRRYKAFEYEGVPVDLFVVLRDREWGPAYLIRTGPGSANEALVTASGMRTRHGIAGVLPPGLRFVEGAVLRGDGPVVTAEERDVFWTAALPYVLPPNRTPERYADMASRRPHIEEMLDAGYTLRMPPEAWDDDVWTPARERLLMRDLL